MVWPNTQYFKKEFNKKIKTVWEKKPSRDPVVGGSLFSALKMYRKVGKRKIREFHSTLITQLDTLLEKNPKS